VADININLNEDALFAIGLVAFFACLAAMAIWGH